MSSFTGRYTILGESTMIDISTAGKHAFITWGDRIITDTFGYIGFWEGFNSDAGRALCKGAARTSALNKYARKYCESELVAYIDYLERQLADTHTP